MAKIDSYYDLAYVLMTETLTRKNIILSRHQCQYLTFICYGLYKTIEGKDAVEFEGKPFKTSYLGPYSTDVAIAQKEFEHRWRINKKRLITEKY